MGFDRNCAREFNAYEVFFIKKEENQSVYPNEQTERDIDNVLEQRDRASIENGSYTGSE